jgi:hypothetical protein
METDELIQKIVAAKRIEQIVDVTNFKSEYRKILMKIHPDVCKHPKATEASDIILRLKDLYENGTTIKDEAGKFTTKGTETVYKGDFDFLKSSFDNYNKLMDIKSPAAANFKKYIPQTMGFSGKDLMAKYGIRAVPLTGQTLPQKHVNWIFSRMLEFSAWMQQEGYTHCGINPESIFVVPENHGIQVSSFYMMSKIGSKPNGISGMYQSWYPPELFRDKVATPAIDVELSKKTAIYLLGDKSGAGIKLRKDPNVHPAILDFLIARHDDAIECFRQYREVLGKHFKKEFHILDL